MAHPHRDQRPCNSDCHLRELLLTSARNGLNLNCGRRCNRPQETSSKFCRWKTETGRTGAARGFQKRLEHGLGRNDRSAIWRRRIQFGREQPVPRCGHLRSPCGNPHGTLLASPYPKSSAIRKMILGGRSFSSAMTGTSRKAAIIKPNRASFRKTLRLMVCS
jgi:hypothetical protein